ncbi:MAG: hypothetical protein RIG62_00505 [Cyclobacteriaceae bacterium]
MRKGDKEEIEERHIQAFWDCQQDYSQGAPEKQAPPEPDFFVQTSQGLIGIEHTRLMRQTDQRGVSPVAHSITANDIIELAEQEFNCLSDIPLFVEVSFRSDYGLIRGDKPLFLGNADIQPLSKFITDFVVNNIPPAKTRKRFESFDRVTRKNRFPEKIRSISIENADHYKVSNWQAPEAGAVARIFESDAFQIRLKEKNDKPKNYKGAYYQIWLVMVDDARHYPTSFNYDDSQIPTLASPFDRIFIFKSATDKILELNVNKSTQ